MDNQIPKIDEHTLRWIAFTKNGNTIVENHSHGRTWKKVYKDNHKNIQALCLQIVHTSEKYFVKESPFDEYWTFEEFEYNMAGNSKHLNRNICSLQKVNIEDSSNDIWEVLSISGEEGVSIFYASSKDIGFEIRSFLDKEAWVL